MKNKNLTLGVLAFLIFVKFVYLPWGEWKESIEAENSRLALINAKQLKAINNEESVRALLVKNEQSIRDFASTLPMLNSEQKINLYWLNLASDIKEKGLKVYNQNVEFISPISRSLGVVTGSMSISGNAKLVMESLVLLEQKSPYLFVGELRLTKPSANSTSELVAQMKIGHLYKFEGESH